MTAFSQEYMRDPRYQKNLRKIVNMDPEQLAVYQAITAEAPFADEEMRRRLQMYQMGAQKDAQTQRLDLASQRQNANYDLRKQAYQNEQSDNRTSELLGIGGLAANTALGLGDLKAKKKLAGMYGLGVMR